MPAAGSGSLAPMTGATCRAWTVEFALWIPVALLSFGCATAPISLTEQGIKHRRHDYTIDRAPSRWERLKVEGTVLSYRRRGPNTMSLQSRCGKPVASPQLMARHLVIRLPERTLVAAGPIAVDGRNAWTQVFDTAQRDTTVRVKTVTLVARDCTFDWVLASSGDFEGAEVDFDAWWGSFRLGPRYQEDGA